MARAALPITAGTKVFLGLCGVALVVVVLLWSGVFAPRDDVWTTVGADQVMDTGPYQVRFTDATASAFDPGSVDVHGQIRLTDADALVLQEDWFGSPGLGAAQWFTIGPADGPFGVELIPGLGWQEFSLHVTTEADALAGRATLPVGALDLRQRRNWQTVGDDSLHWVPAPTGQRTEVPLRVTN